MSERIYLDSAATTRLDERVLQSMLNAPPGNAHSRDHAFGWDAAEAVEDARSRVADLIGAQPREILFTSGATESICWVFQAIGRKSSAPLVISSLEHAAIVEVCSRLRCEIGATIISIPCDSDGNSDLQYLSRHTQETPPSLLAWMWANNEIGTVASLPKLAALARQVDALFFTDAAQAVGKIPINVKEANVDLMAFSAHKIYGPQGMGAIYLRDGEPKIELDPMIVGGGQERGLRGGTLNVPGIVGFGEACRIAKLEMEQDAQHTRRLRDHLEREIQNALPDISINGGQVERLPNISNICFHGVDARTMIRDMHNIAVSTRSACSSGDSKPSHVLKALGLSGDDAFSSIRFSLSRFTTDEEIDYTIGKVIQSVRKLRKIRGYVARLERES